MKNLKKIVTLFIVAALMCGTMLLGACGGGGTKEYTVTVKDALGNTYGSGIIVLFYSGDEQVAMQVCDENGVATKELEAGDYTVKLQYTDSEASYYYNEEGLKLSAKETSVDVILAKAPSGEAETLVVETKEYEAYEVEAGCNYVELEAEDRNYVVFQPKEAGTYEFYVLNNDKVTVGYYGAPHFVQSTNLAEVKDGKITLSVTEGMVGEEDSSSRWVFGLDTTDGSKNCILIINRVGDPGWTIEEEDWVVYEPTVELAPYSLAADAELVDFDVTAAGYTLVFNEADGFYHLDTVDGPVVLVRLTEDPKYMDCFKTILEYTGVVKYFFDENDEFVKKETYSECLLEYIECADENHGVYPLTEDLKYIIEQSGDHQGWWDTQSSTYIFVNEAGDKLAGINHDIAWLFMCCYIAD